MKNRKIVIIKKGYAAFMGHGQVMDLAKCLQKSVVLYTPGIIWKVIIGYRKSHVY